MIKKNTKTLCFIAAWLFALKVSAKEPLIISQTSVPAGFEDLLAPQQSMIDVYFGGRFVTTMSATFTTSTVEFEDPEKLVRQLPAVLDAFPVIQALEGELDSHTEAVCYGRSTQGCGIIEPEVAGVIFNADNFRADLFIHPSLLTVQALDKNRFLPGSEAGPAVIQNLSANISGTLNDGNSEDNYTVFGSSFLSFEENSVQANWDFSRDQKASVNTLLFERDYQGHLWQAGLVNTTGFGLNFSASRRLWGARVASSFNTRTDRSFTQGTPLEIYMPVRGRYEIIYEERLISSGFLEAGNQELDTTNFPSGAYDLTIKILDEANNLVRTETRFFAKQTRLAPIGENEYFLEGGRVSLSSADKILPEVQDDVLVRGGVNMRLGDTLSGSFALAATEGQSLAEASFFKIGRRYELAPSFMLSDEGDYGGKLDARYRYGQFNISGSYFQLWRSDEVRPTTEFDLLGNEFRQSSVSMNYPLLDGNASYRYSESESASTDGTTNNHQTRQSVGYSRSIYRDGLYSVSMRFDTSWTDEGQISGLISFDLSRSESQWTFRANPQARYDKDTEGKSDRTEQMQVSATYNNRDSVAGNFRSTIRAEKRSSGQTTAGLTSRLASTWGTANLNVNHVDNDSNRTTGYSANLSTSFMANSNVFAFGGESQSRSAVVVTVDGASLGDQFDVYIDNQRRGYALGGKPSIIHLSPFRTYKVSIRPTGSSIFSFDEKEYEVTLYPGNVMDLDYSVDSVRVLYGRVKTNDGDWLANASVQGGVGLAVSDEYGMFQAEITDDSKQLIFVKGGRQCLVDLDVGDKKDDFINLGQVVCHYADVHNQAKADGI
ncbi:TcfC E-set like domain-containing protein [Endozoicomonas gorgoniicola]|uniref:TcfC E-set like domain-containing protein n=1 Tax=Endozoicomonas gorgoniicola TaxID=1234144 RepID=A0ABT3N2H1_9GAMM|nr:CS1-pili formation C-terminal domain-containing protein [Endozoicomonas gorgoniicola]MCW7555821.1 TcfC E-set like domain-containing protein [Endozoicomonas gorgoniicola]